MSLAPANVCQKLSEFILPTISCTRGPRNRGQNMFPVYFSRLRLGLLLIDCQLILKDSKYVTVNYKMYQ